MTSPLVLTACLLWAPVAGATTIFEFSLPESQVTSAGVYEPTGRLVRTLWSGRKLLAGKHTFSWDDKEDSGTPVVGKDVVVRLLYHNVSYHWDGVIGNSSAAFTGAHIHRSMFPPSSLAISADRAFYAVGYNEGQVGGHGFALGNPQVNLQPLQQIDPFTAWSLVASDGKRIYWANTGGLKPLSFVASSSVATGMFTPFPAGSEVCLAFLGSNCYPSTLYKGVIDKGEEKSLAPTGLAVQTTGNLLAVAHGPQGLVRLFDKMTGAFLRSFEIPVSATQGNQLGAAPSGDIWVVSGKSVDLYTALDARPTKVASIEGLSHPLAVAVHPGDENLVLVADGGSSQQLKAFDRKGRHLWSYGAPGGYAADPAVSFDKLWFRYDSTERTAIAFQPDGSFWVVDTCNNRMLHISQDLRFIEQIAYLPTSYSATVDTGNPERTFSNYLEFDVDQTSSLQPGVGGWRLVRNWLADLPSEALLPASRNGGGTGFHTVVTLSNGRTYALTTAGYEQVLLELPKDGPARHVRTFTRPGPGDSGVVLYENGDLGYVRTGNLQSIQRQSLTGFSPAGDPGWESRPRIIGTVPVRPGAPTYKGAFSGATAPRFPVTSSGKLIFFDQSVNRPGPDLRAEHHLGAIELNGRDWIWKASSPGLIDEPGAFLTQALDKSLQYGGNMVWAVGQHIVYGYHGEGFSDRQRAGVVGQANQFMHFHDSGLYIGQFGVPTTRASDGTAGAAGNAFSNILVSRGQALWLFHNDESRHGGVHRWTIDNLASVGELTGTGMQGSVISLSTSPP